LLGASGVAFAVLTLWKASCTLFDLFPIGISCFRWDLKRTCKNHGGLLPAPFPKLLQLAVQQVFVKPFIAKKQVEFLG
jgi:hypothetical protein